MHIVELLSMSNEIFCNVLRHVINIQKIIITINIVVMIDNLWWCDIIKQRCVGSPFPSSLHPFIHPPIHAHTHSFLYSRSSAAEVRTRRSTTQGPSGKAVPISVVASTSNSPLCHFLLQNSPLWWLKAKRP